MRIATQFKLIIFTTIAALLLLLPALIWSWLEFRHARNDYLLSNTITLNLFERITLQSQYVLYREERIHEQWDNNKLVADQLLQRAFNQFEEPEMQQRLQQLRQNIAESNDIFHRIINNTPRLNEQNNNYHIYVELDRRLASQLLLKDAAIRNDISTIKDGDTQHVERAYRNVIVCTGIFSLLLTLLTLFGATRLDKLIRKRLAALHHGVQTVAGGNLTHRIIAGGQGEFAELARSINSMADRLNAEIAAHTQAEDMLRKLSIAVERSPVSVVITDTKADIQYVNSYFINITGYQAEEVIGQNPRIFRSGQTNPDIYAELWGNLLSGQAWHGELLNKRKNGELYWEETHISPVKNAQGINTHYVAVKIDITQRKNAEAQIKQSEARLRAILDNVPYLIWLKDLDGRFIAVNKAFATTTKLAHPHEVLGKTDMDIWPTHIAQKFRADDQEILQSRTQKLIEEIAVENGEARWYETFKAPIIDNNGNLLGTTGFSQDITARKNAEREIRHMAHYDALTDLPNRTLLYDRLQQAITAAKRDKSLLVLMFIDLDRFKPINDQFGHHIGDLLLKEAAHRIQQCVRESDTVARIGGDEFVVLLPSVEAEQAALLVAEKIREHLNQDFALAGLQLNISSSIGIAVYPEHGKDEVQLMTHADSAMYNAKQAGRNSVRFYHADMG